MTTQSSGSIQPTSPVSVERTPGEQTFSAHQIDERVIRSAIRQVKTAALVTIALGAALAISSTDATDALARLFGDLVFLRPGDQTGSLTDHNHLINAIGGGVMAGWAVMFWLLADRLLPVAPREVKQIMLGSLLCWFVLDSSGSIASGAWFNAVLNIGFFAMFWAPLRRL